MTVDSSVLRLYTLKLFDMYAEKRRHYRFCIRDDVFTSLGHEFITVGKIRDISQGGLSFTCWSDEGLSSEPSRVLDLFSERSGLQIHSIACKVVYNTNENPWNTNSPVTLPVTSIKCGVQFENLTYYQKVRLVYIIETVEKPQNNDFGVCN